MSRASGRLSAAALAALLLVLHAREGAAASATGGSLPTARFLFFHPDTSGLPPSEVLKGLENYARYFRERGIAELAPLYFRRAGDLEAALRKWEQRGEDLPWFASFAVPYLLEHGHRYGYRPVVCAHLDGKNTFQYTVVARRKSALHSLGDARGGVAALTDLGVDAVHWANLLIFGGTLDMRQHFSRLLETDSPISSVMAVLFQQADVAIVLKPLIDRMSESAERIWRDVRVIHTSPPMHFGGVAAWVGAPRRVVEEFRRTLTGDLREQSGGQAILDAFYIDGFHECGWEAYDGLEARYLRQAGVALPTGEERERLAERARPGAPAAESR